MRPSAKERNGKGKDGEREREEAKKEKGKGLSVGNRVKEASQPAAGAEVDMEMVELERGGEEAHMGAGVNPGWV